MGDDVPALGVLIDLPLGILMWCAILRFLLSMVVKEDSKTGVMRLLNGLVMPPVHLLRHATPRWVIERTGPLYLAFLLFILRFYVAPLALGYDITGLGGLPLENLILSVRTEVGL
ncbi:MAG TPA: hypothetical protein DGU02_10090 [Alphaproteobacteria bacterium]|jgi:uncharacterized protein YggT (Ycf19 family)|nr:MAG: hypothetical protein CNE93_04570 [SAR116 cluster bacterium MED-G06]HCV89531.1 hypothetical protein [Alphaproteobacteria bacterium]|tara:strand:+ start:3516 stop:3860 length:345 start_codon:yes stop_codon:yes gene_type:complete